MRLTTLTFTSIIALVSLAIAPKRASANDALIAAAQAAICGPGHDGLRLNGHDFNVKKATVGRQSTTDLTVVVAGQISHRLALRADDQIYYTVNYKNGVPDPGKIRIDRGGFAVYLDLIVDALKIVSLEKLTIAGTEFALNPEKLPEISTELSKLVEGSGWEEQAAAMIAFIGIAATQPENEVCTLEPEAPRGGGGTGPRHDGPPIHQN